MLYQPLATIQLGLGKESGKAECHPNDKNVMLKIEGDKSAKMRQNVPNRDIKFWGVSIQSAG
jgi:hypothetical protein